MPLKRRRRSSVRASSGAKASANLFFLQWRRSVAISLAALVIIGSLGVALLVRKNHTSPPPVTPVTQVVVTPLGSNRDTAEEYAEALRMKFIADRIPYATNRAIKILGASPISDGHTEGGMYAYSVMLSYRVYLVA